MPSSLIPEVGGGPRSDPYPGDAQSGGVAGVAWSCGRGEARRRSFAQRRRSAWRLPRRHHV